MPDPKDPQAAAPDPAAPEPPRPQVEQPTREIDPSAKNETTSAAEAPTPPPVSQPVPSGRRAKFGRFTRHRATGLVAAGLLGLVIGGGLVAVFDHDGRGAGVSHHHGRFDDRGPERGPDRGPERGPDRFER